MRWFFLSLCLFLGACVSPVVIDSQEDAKLNQFRSYAFVEQNEDQPRELDDQRARTALKTALAEKGLTASASGQADVHVKHFFKREQRYDGSVVQFGFGFSRNNVGIGTTTPVEGDITEEYKLVVQMIDPATNNVVWQATSRDRLYDDMRSERRNEHIQKAVDEMFQRYPG
jgi:hypothetical protein